jgi:low temperature requirement protein LtrA
MAETPVARKRSQLRLRTLEPTAVERHASWLELFFDLVFVIAVAQLALILSGHTDLIGLAKYLALFAPVWWAWVGFTFYGDRFETEETKYRILMFAGMLAVAGLSLTLGGAFSPQGDLAFIVCYDLVLLVLVAMYGRAAYYVPLARAYCLPFVIGLGISAVLLLISLLFEAPARYAIWAIAFALELAVPFLNPRAARSIPIDRSHIPERFGLFTIIVLGEAVIATANSAAMVPWNFATITTACLGFAMAACIWWINFEFVEDSAITSRELTPRIVYLYGHLFIVASIVAVSVGVEHAIIESVEPYLHFPTLALLTIGFTVYLVAITIIRLITGVCNLFYSRIAAIAVLLSLLYFGRMLPPLAVMAVLLLILSAAVWVETYYAEEKMEDEEPQLAPCEHAGEMQVFKPRSTDGCEECRKNNYKWVHLRLCLSCGHVGCCYSSVHKHATKHFHTSEHPIAASLEPGEHWAWCYGDERFVPLPKRVGD